jgi:hypothetical protein
MKTTAEPKPQTCIDLKARFGHRYKITYDPAYDPKRKRNPDPWYMLLPCRYGDIGPQGGDVLRIELEGRHPKITRQLVEAGCVVTRDADDGHTLLFPVDKFNAVARIVKPRMRRTATEAQREAARQTMRRYLAGR